MDNNDIKNKYIKLCGGKKPFCLDYYLKLFGLDLKTPDGFEKLTEEERNEYMKTFKMPIKKKK